LGSGQGPYGRRHSGCQVSQHLKPLISKEFNKAKGDAME